MNLYKEELTHELSALPWMSMLPDPDPILRTMGDYGMEILRNLTSDDRVLTSVQTRKVGTLGIRDYGFIPGAKKGKKPSSRSVTLAERLEEDLSKSKGFDYYEFIPQILDAPLYGNFLSELVYDRNRPYSISKIIPRPIEWFQMDTKGNVFYKNGVSNMKPIDERKYVLVKHFPDSTNPYGLRLMSRCFWLVSFKKGGIKFWAKFLEKYGFPQVIAKGGSSRVDRLQMAQDLRQMVQDAVAVLPLGTEYDMHNPGTGGADAHDRFVAYIDGCISRIIMGQDLTAQIGKTGSYAASKTHENVLTAYQESDQQIVETFFNNLGRIYGLLNDPNAEPPKFSFNKQEDLESLIKVDQGLHTLGVRFTKSFIAERYRIPEEGFELTEPTSDTPSSDNRDSPPGDGTSVSRRSEPGERRSDDAPASDGSPGTKEEGADGDGAALSSPLLNSIHEIFGRNQDEIDDLAHTSFNGISAQAGDILVSILSEVSSADTLPEAMEKVLSIFPNLDFKKLEDLMANTMLAASLFGEEAVDIEVSNDN